VPPGIAEWLGVTQVTYATELSLLSGRWWLRARRDFSSGHEIVTTPLPAVVSLRSRCNEPRFMDMDRRAWARTGSVTVWSAQDLDVDPEMIGLSGSATVVAGTQEASKRDRRREALKGSIDERAHALAEIIRPYIDGQRAAAQQF